MQVDNMPMKKNTLTLSSLCSRACLLLLLSALALSARAERSMSLYLGDMEVLKLGGAISRVAVGNGKIISTSILEDGQLLVLAEAAGDTELRLWLESGAERLFSIHVSEQDPQRASNEMRSALRNLPGVTLRRVGGNVVVEGVVNEEGERLIQQIAGVYKLIDLTTKNQDSLVAQVLDTSLPGVRVRQVGKYAVIEGAVSKAEREVIDKVKQSFQNVLDLTHESRVDSKKMVYMKVQFTEFNTSKLDNLGINWETSISGPSGAFAKNFLAQAGGSVLKTGTPLDGLAGSGIGYFGIATAISSQINLSVSNGDALLLASPTLSARSGGKAEFLSGGEVPVPVPGPNLTTTIEYKKFGIILKVEPQAGDDGNILAKVGAEISNLDQSLAVGNSPGFRSRKASTEVSLKSGQTLVISGLVNHELAEDVSGLAGLRDIPILGALFRSSNFRNARSDLVIFITPFIYDPDSDLNRASVARADELRERFLKAVDENADILD